MLRIYVRLWLLLFLLLLFESFMLNFFPESGVIGTLKSFGYFPHMSLNPQTGKSISLFLGWTGFGLMCLTNLYSIRKRLLGNTGGSLAHWLDFHIFCGLLGPTLILFHTNFKIGGLVAVSFWSMVISFASGIVGRYFYLQVAGRKSDLDREVQLHEQAFQKVANLPKDQFERLRGSAYLLACIPANSASVGLLSSLFRTMRGDLQMHFRFSRLTEGLPPAAAASLESMVLAARRGLFIEQFRRLMGYWHSFHLPFAIFMYVVAFIHIATATLLGVGELQ